MAPLAERFEAKVDRSGEHHVWIGARQADGVGVIWVDGKLTTARRVGGSWSTVRSRQVPGSVAVRMTRRAFGRLT